MRKWGIVVLALAWLIWELVGVLDGPGNVWTLTEIIRTYVPYEVTMAGIAVLVAWLPVHFARRKRRTQPKE